MTTSQSILFVSQLVKSYASQPVLKGVDFSVEPGERVALMGPSGCGKSTLLNCLAGIDRPDSGRIRIGGTAVEACSADELARLRREQVSTVFQFFHLLPTLTAFENIELPLQLVGLGREDRARRVGELIEAVGLAPRASALPDELSGGEMQRVAIARALVHRPRLLLADEPTGNLDSRTGDAVLDLLKNLTERYGMAMLMVTHSIDATRICARVLHMADGAILTPASS